MERLAALLRKRNFRFLECMSPSTYSMLADVWGPLGTRITGRLGNSYGMLVRRNLHQKTARPHESHSLMHLVKHESHTGSISTRIPSIKSCIAGGVPMA
jgi:hypothetical protein